MSPHHLDFKSAYNDRILDTLVATCAIELIQYDAATRVLRTQHQEQELTTHQLLQAQKQLHKHLSPQRHAIDNRHAVLTGRYALSYTNGTGQQVLDELFDLAFAPGRGAINIASYDMTCSYTEAQPYRFALVFSHPSKHPCPLINPALPGAMDTAEGSVPWLSLDSSQFDSFVLLFNRKRNRKLWKQCLKDIFGYPTLNVPKALGIDSRSSSRVTSRSSSPKENKVVVAKRSSGVSTKSQDTIGAKEPSTARASWRTSLSTLKPRRESRDCSGTLSPRSSMMLQQAEAIRQVPVLADKEPAPAIPQKSTSRKSIQSFKAYTRRKFNVSTQALDNEVRREGNSSPESFSAAVPAEPIQQRSHSLTYYNSNGHVQKHRVVKSAEEFYSDKYLQQALKESNFKCKASTSDDEGGINEKQAKKCAWMTAAIQPLKLGKRPKAEADSMLAVPNIPTDSPANGSKLSVLLTESFDLWAPTPSRVHSDPDDADAELDELGQSDASNDVSTLATTPSIVPNHYVGGNSSSESEYSEPSASSISPTTHSSTSRSSRISPGSSSSQTSDDAHTASKALNAALPPPPRSQPQSLAKSDLYHNHSYYYASRTPADHKFANLESWVSNTQGWFLNPQSHTPQPHMSTSTNQSQDPPSQPHGQIIGNPNDAIATGLTVAMLAPPPKNLFAEYYDSPTSSTDSLNRGTALICRPGGTVPGDRTSWSSFSNSPVSSSPVQPAKYRIGALGLPEILE